MNKSTFADSRFANVPKLRIPRSQFKRPSHYKCTMMNTAGVASLVYPIYFDEVLPADTHNMRARFFARLATPIAPFMDNLYLDVQAWWCPNRLLWVNWEKMNGAQDNPGDSIDFTTPQIVASAVCLGWVDLCVWPARVGNGALDLCVHRQASG